jgi:hypothetical protein
MLDQSTIAPAVAIPAGADRPTQRRIFLYLGILIFLLSFGSPSAGLIDIPIGFFLKNKLHLQAHEVAIFRLVAAIPVYLAFIFGFIRDTHSPFGMGDRGYLMLFGAPTAFIYVLLALVPFSYESLLAAMALIMVFYIVVASAQEGFTSIIGQQLAMSGQISAVWNVVRSIPAIVALLLGGLFSNRLEHLGGDKAARMLFLFGGVCMAAVVAYALSPQRSFMR